MKKYDKTDLNKRFQQRQEDSFISRNHSFIKELLDEIETEYLNFYYPGYLKKEGRKSLNKITANRLIS